MSETVMAKDSWATEALRKVLVNAHAVDPKDANTTSDPEATKLASSLGLTRQAERHEHGADSIPIAFAEVRLKEIELGAWRIYCPTRYISGTPEFSNYGFDTIPKEVLARWAKIKADYAFDSFEIWTTERTAANDPLLIGTYQGAHYLLARWGKEAENLLPFAEVLEEVRRRLRFFFSIDELPPKVAETVRWFEERFPLTQVLRIPRNDGGLLWLKRHCGAPLMAFEVGSAHEVMGICRGCGGKRLIGHNYPYHDL
jgi:hypothetical protein